MKYYITTYYIGTHILEDTWHRYTRGHVSHWKNVIFGSRAPSYVVRCSLKTDDLIWHAILGHNRLHSADSYLWFVFCTLSIYLQLSKHLYRFIDIYIPTIRYRYRKVLRLQSRRRYTLIMHDLSMSFYYERIFLYGWICL